MRWSSRSSLKEKKREGGGCLLLFYIPSFISLVPIFLPFSLFCITFPLERCCIGEANSPEGCVEDEDHEGLHTVGYRVQHPHAPCQLLNPKQIRPLMFFFSSIICQYFSSLPSILNKFRERSWGFPLSQFAKMAANPGNCLRYQSREPTPNLKINRKIWIPSFPYPAFHLLRIILPCLQVVNLNIS